jgi:hypothetical protein
VTPKRATSVSCTAPAPFVARASSTPRRIQSMSSGDNPTLITCAPIVTITARPLRLASTIASTTARSSLPAKISGSESKKSAKPGARFEYSTELVERDFVLALTHRICAHL